MSRIIRSKVFELAWKKPSSPVCAMTISYPSVSSPSFSAPATLGSSSTTRIFAMLPQLHCQPSRAHLSPEVFLKVSFTGSSESCQELFRCILHTEAAIKAWVNAIFFPNRSPSMRTPRKTGVQACALSLAAHSGVTTAPELSPGRRHWVHLTRQRESR